MSMRRRALAAAVAALLLVAAADRRSWTDDLGRRVTAPRHPRRILPYAPNLTEILFAIGAGDRVVGRTRFCDWPPEAKRIPSFGGLLDPDFEKIATLRPDLVLATTVGDPRNQVEALDRLGYPVYVTSPSTVEDVIRSVEAIGRVVDAERGSRVVAARMRAQLAEVRARVRGRRPLRTLVVIWQDPLRVAGPGTFFADLVRHAGGDPVLEHGEAKYPQMSMEAVVAQAPEVIVLGLLGEPGQGAADYWQKYRAIPAVRNGRIVSISLERLTRPGPRMTEALVDLARAIHPEAYADRQTPSGSRDAPGRTARGAP